MQRLRPYAPAAAAYGASRLVTLAAAWAATWVPFGLGSGVYQFEPFSRRRLHQPLTDVLTRWDGQWYLEIARRGYVTPSAAPHHQSNIAFFPLYPLFIRWVGNVSPFSDAANAIAIAVLAGLGATLVIWRLIRDQVDEDAARRAITFFCFFPGSFVLSFAYSEALLLLLAGWCLLALQRRQWLAAGIAAALAGATRTTGATLVLACAFAAFEAIRRRREWRALVSVVLAPLGVVGYFTYLRVHEGSWTTWFEVQRRGWHQRTDFGVGATEAFVRWLANPFHNPGLMVIGVSTVFAGFGLFALWRVRLSGAIAVYGLAVVVLSLLSPDLQLRPRFVLAAFPLLLAFGMWVRPKRQVLVLSVSSGCLAVLTFLYGIGLSRHLLAVIP